MYIKFAYKNTTVFSEQEEEFLFRDSKIFGWVETKKYSSRFGVTDLISIIETSLTFIILTNIRAFAKGFIGEDWFKRLGEKARREVEHEINQAQEFIKAYYNVFIRNKANEQEAHVFSMNIDDVILYVVINHYYMSDLLLYRLPKSLVDIYGRVYLGYIDVESKCCQLYPDFENNQWRYLFIPTNNAFGNYVDRFYDRNTNEIVQLKSKQDFLERFNLIDEDKYKLIINALIDR